MGRGLRIAVVALIGLACLWLGSVVPSPLSAVSDLIEAPDPFDEHADARRELAVATARAKAADKLVIIEFGANWCPSCRALGDLVRSPEVQKVLNDRYEFVAVDIGRFDKNLDIYSSFGGELMAVPSVLVVHPTTGNLLNPDDLLPFGEAEEMTPKDVADWLRKQSASVRGAATEVHLRS